MPQDYYQKDPGHRESDKKLLLLTNGCSWTKGSGLADTSLNWSYWLGQHLNVSDLVNLSRGGGSNDRIFRTTWDWLSQHASNRTEKIIAVIQWTELSRYEYYVPLSQDIKENIHDQWAMCKIDYVHSNEPMLSLEQKIHRTNQHLSTYTHVQGSYKLLMCCEALANIFRSYNVQYFFWNLAFGLRSAPDHVMQRLSQYTWLDEDPVHGKQHWTYERISDRDPHPSLLGHQQIADQIYHKIKNLV